VPTPVRVLLPVDGYHQQSWDFALGYAEQINEARSAEKTVLLLHQKNILDHSTLAGMMHPSHKKALLKNQALNLPSGAKLVLHTMQNIPRILNNATVIVFYADDRILELVDGIKNLAGVVVVPDVLGEIEQWKARWNPQVPGEKSQAPKQIIDDPVVEQALISLTSLVNTGNGVMVSRDKEWAKDVLSILRAKGHSEDAGHIKSWAIKNGWQPKAATELAALAKKIFERRTKPSLANIANAHERYQRWCDGED
jgi:hypothetical protein